MTRALVVHESMWGNSERLARAVAEGVAAVMPVDVTDVAAAPVDLGDVSLLLAGRPTHRRSMSRPETRRSARCLGALHGLIATGLREWREELPDEHDRWLATRHVADEVARAARVGGPQRGARRAAPPVPGGGPPAQLLPARPLRAARRGRARPGS
jgi:hypothetical protein